MKSYWSHLFSRHKLRGKYITWILDPTWGWVRVCRMQFSWRYIAKKEET